MVFAYVPGMGTTVTIKGQEKVTIAGAPFAQMLFSVWLGPKPPNAGLKKGLLEIKTRQRAALSSRCQPSRQPLRQVRGEDPVLRAFEVVGHALEGDDPLIAVKDGEGGAPVSIAWLPYRAGIDQVSHILFQGKLHGLALADGFVGRPEGIAGCHLERKRALQVRMSKKGDRDRKRA